MTEPIMALVRDPFALLMAALAFVLMIVGLCVRGFDRVLMIALAVMSGAAAWIMATGWRWR